MEISIRIDCPIIEGPRGASTFTVDTIVMSGQHGLSLCRIEGGGLALHTQTAVPGSAPAIQHAWGEGQMQHTQMAVPGSGHPARRPSFCGGGDHAPKQQCHS